MSTCTTIYKYVKDVKVLDNNQISKNYKKYLWANGGNYFLVLITDFVLCVWQLGYQKQNKTTISEPLKLMRETKEKT